jgi:gamma-glutamyltranspeptidase/glutathione hydrolase
VTPERPLLRGGRGALACGHPLAASAGAAILHAGGNAVDAATAAGAVLLVVLPDACGLGGDALALVRTPDGRELAYNGSGAAPAALRGAIPAEGAGAAAVPGAIAALADLHAAHGVLPWERVLAPAIALARDGVPLTAALRGAIERNRQRLERTAPAWPPLDGALAVGSRLLQPELAALMRAIAEDGPAALYEGAPAEAIAAASARSGGFMSADDLRAHRTPVLAPVVRSRLGARISAQPPVSQALLVLIALGALEACGPADGSDRTHALIEAISGAFAYRDAIGADGADAGMLADASVPIDPERASGGLGARGGSHTTAVAAADSDGVVVSMLLSVFAEFGSGVRVPEGGFFLNDRLHGFTAGANSAAPGRRPVHTLSPLLVEEGSRAYALCTPGADGQVQTLSQILTAVLLGGVALPDAIAAPRWRVVGEELVVEASFDPAVRGALARRGHRIVELPDGVMQFGAAACAGIDATTGTTFAAADPRQEVWATAA